MRTVLDTNIFYRAIICKSGPCRSILEANYRGVFTLLLSKETLEEARKVILGFLDREASLSKIDKDEILRMFMYALLRAENVDVRSKLKKSRHGADNKFVRCAIDGNADYIISADDHLLSITEPITNLGGKPVHIEPPERHQILLFKHERSARKL